MFWYSVAVIQPLVELLTHTFEGKRRDCRTRSHKTPPRPLKTITAGSLVPSAIAANATVNPVPCHVKVAGQWCVSTSQLQRTAACYALQQVGNYHMVGATCISGYII